MDKWLENYVETELKKYEPESVLNKILADGYKKIDTNLKHFEVYQKGAKKILYNPSKGEIDMVYSTKKVFERVNRNINLNN